MQELAPLRHLFIVAFAGPALARRSSWTLGLTEMSRLGAVVALAMLGYIQPCWAESAPNVTRTRLLAARGVLLKAGWKPRQTYLMNGDGQRESQWGDAGKLFRFGVTEVEFCNGTGAGYCFYNYLKDGHCLRLLTQGEFSPGEYQPFVIKQTRECPPKEAIARVRTSRSRP